MTNLLKIAAFAIPACAMLALAQPAGAAKGETTAAADAAAPAAGHMVKAPRKTKVCINVIPDTGSRMARRVCRTKSEWRDEGIQIDAER